MVGCSERAEICERLVFNGSDSHFVKTSLILEYTDRIDESGFTGFNRHMVSSKF